MQYAHRLFFSRRKKNWKFPFRYYLKRNKLDKKIIKTIITIIILQFQYRWINIYLSLALVLFSIIVSYISISLSLSSSLWRAIGGFQIVNENHFWMKKHTHIVHIWGYIFCFWPSPSTTSWLNECLILILSMFICLEKKFKKNLYWDF